MSSFRHLWVLIACGATIVTTGGCDGSSETGTATVMVDQQMREAEDRGRATLPLFIEAFRDPEPRWAAFQVRYVFKTDEGYEGTVWLDLDSIGPGGAFLGTIPEDEDPRIIPFDLGQQIKLDSADVSDWMFIDERGRWVGGYTLRVTMDRSLGTGIDPEDNIHGGTEFRDLDDPEEQSADPR